MKKTYLITGGAGFIGSNLIDTLIFSGEDVNIVCVDNFDPVYSEKIKQNNISLHRTVPNYKLYIADITDYTALKRIFTSNAITQIIHLAGKSGVRASLETPEEYFMTNINGTVNLLRLAKEFFVKKFIFASSGSVYGLSKDIPFCEDMKIDMPISPFVATKAVGEQICYTYSHLYGINTVCLRFFSVYGERQRPDSVIHKFSRLTAEGKTLPIFGKVTDARDYTYIDDIIQGILASVTYDKSKFEIFNIARGKPVKLEVLIDLIEKNLNKKAVIEKKGNLPGHISLTYADISKAKELLGYQPTTDTEHGLQKFTAWFKEFYRYATV